jgi:hypothetical protein
MGEPAEAEDVEIPVGIVDGVAASATGMPYWWSDEVEDVECERRLGRSMPVESMSPESDLERCGMGLQERDKEEMLLLLRCETWENDGDATRCPFDASDGAALKSKGAGWMSWGVGGMILAMEGCAEVKAS